MDFVALISGGKDSCYNIYKCQQYGHRLVCLANLQSPQNDESNEEINSFMYQSAGSSVIPAYQECLQVPLFRRIIQGSAISQSMSYESSIEGDEVEDLYCLLKEVKTQFPSITGVSCGAIVSNYQRHRVENICQRLGLTCLSYLWQRDRKELIYEIVQDSGMDVVLVKVAGAGLEPNKHLGKSLIELLPTLDRLNKKFGLDYCGEGGEYESLVLDAPFFHKKIEIEEKIIIYDDEDPTIGMLKILSWKLVDKRKEEVQTPSTKQLALTNSFIQSVHYEKELMEGRTSNTINVSVISSTTILISNNSFGQTALILPSASRGKKNEEMVTKQVNEVLEALRAVLTLHEIDLSDSLFIHLYISDMSLFSIVNNEYCKWFQQYPPSRCCVEMTLDEGIHVALYSTFQKNSYRSMIAEKRKLDVREVVHVRSMSEWAPLCIGPYAQSNKINNSLILIAGQIPLDPGFMTLANPVNSNYTNKSLSNDIYLSLRHVRNVLEVNQSNIQNIIYAVLYVNQEIQAERSSLKSFFWDAYDNLLMIRMGNIQSGNEFDENLDDYSNKDPNQALKRTEELFPLLIVTVPALPRGASVEIEVAGLADNLLPVTGWTRWSKVSSVDSKSISSSSSSSSTSMIIHSPSNCQSSFQVHLSSLQYGRCVSSHVIEIVTSELTETVLYSDSVLVQALVQNLNQSLLKAERKLSSFLSINLFYSLDLFDERSLERCVYYQLGKHGLQDTVVVLLPMKDFKNSTVLQLFSFTIDFQQIETESWIYN